MNLQQEDLDYIKDHLGEWLAERSLGKPAAVYEIELRERMVRVEEELKHQRELIKQILVEMDKRFDAVDKRFEAMDKRFEAIQIQMDKRFEAVDKRFDAAEKRFDALTKRIDHFMIWSFGITVSSAGIIIAVLKLWPTAASS
jgi:Flp pilus assembly protein TadB